MKDITISSFKLRKKSYCEVHYKSDYISDFTV